MAFTISASTVLVSGTETLLSFATWAVSNPTAAKKNDDDNVEAIYQLKIQNGANFDTSLGVLTINHRVEGQAQATTDSGVWKNHGGMVIVQGTATQYSEWWAIFDWNRATVVINKTGANPQSFIRGDGCISHERNQLRLPCKFRGSRWSAPFLWRNGISGRLPI